MRHYCKLLPVADNPVKGLIVVRTRKVVFPSIYEERKSDQSRVLLCSNQSVRSCVGGRSTCGC